MLDFQKELLYLWILTLNYTIMKKFYYVILSMIASQSGDSGCIVYTPDDMNIAGTLIGGVTNSNPSYFMPASRTVEKYGLELY